MHLSSILFLMTIKLVHSSTGATLNSAPTTMGPVLTSEARQWSCTFCQTRACRCSSDTSLLNCSSYLLNLTWASDCADMFVWETVDFSSRNLDRLDQTTLLSLRMRRLLLGSNLISAIRDGPFDSLGEVLVELDLQMNQLASVSPSWLNSKLVQLKKLNLALNQLTSFNQLDQVHLPSLKELNVSWNQIEIFPSQLLQWQSLTLLDLSFNQLSSVPRYALAGLNDLAWLSLASNRDLSCIVQDSFKHLKSLRYLDVSSTNLFALDGCIFLPLVGLRTLKIERVSINCSSCWVPIAKKNSVELLGQCLNNVTVQRLDSLTHQQLRDGCTSSSIDCSSDQCDPNVSSFEQRAAPRDDAFGITPSPSAARNRTIEIVLAVVFSLIAVIVIVLVIIIIYRWKQGRKLFCCEMFPSAATATTTRRHDQRHKQAIKSNSTVIESVVTHGTNMDIPSYSQQNYAYADERTSNAKRKLYNPMFSDSPRSDIRNDHHTVAVSNDTSAVPSPSHHRHQSFSENL